MLGVGMDGPGIEFRYGRDFPHPSRPSLVPIQRPVEWLLGIKRPGRGVDHPPPSLAGVKNSVDLYLCSPLGPSYPVLGSTF
jgi:hypothetical protein